MRYPAVDLSWTSRGDVSVAERMLPVVSKIAGVAVSGLTPRQPARRRASTRLPRSETTGLPTGPQRRTVGHGAGEAGTGPLRSGAAVQVFVAQGTHLSLFSRVCGDQLQPPASKEDPTLRPSLENAHTSLLIRPIGQYHRSRGQFAEVVNTNFVSGGHFTDTKARCVKFTASRRPGPSPTRRFFIPVPRLCGLAFGVPGAFTAGQKQLPKSWPNRSSGITSANTIDSVALGRQTLQQDQELAICRDAPCRGHATLSGLLHHRSNQITDIFCP